MARSENEISYLADILIWLGEGEGLMNSGGGGVPQLPACPIIPKCLESLTYRLHHAEESSSDTKQHSFAFPGVNVKTNKQTNSVV
jgi:hypothetical protein